MANEKRLIDANALLHDNVWLCGGFVGDPYSDGYMDALDKVETVIREFPTVDAVEVVHGRWINWGKSGTPTYENYGTCSVCHEDAEICTEHRNYCPNCGAKMDGGDENGC